MSIVRLHPGPDRRRRAHRPRPDGSSSSRPGPRHSTNAPGHPDHARRPRPDGRKRPPHDGRRVPGSPNGADHHRRLSVKIPAPCRRSGGHPRSLPFPRTGLAGYPRPRNHLGTNARRARQSHLGLDHAWCRPSPVGAVARTPFRLRMKNVPASEAPRHARPDHRMRGVPRRHAAQILQPAQLGPCRGIPSHRDRRPSRTSHAHHGYRRGRHHDPRGHPHGRPATRAARHPGRRGNLAHPHDRPVDHAKRRRDHHGNPLRSRSEEHPHDDHPRGRHHAVTRRRRRCHERHQTRRYAGGAAALPSIRHDGAGHARSQSRGHPAAQCPARPASKRFLGT